MAKFFVALNFAENSLLSQKISGFRKRFDPKYRTYSFFHMSLLAPFEVQDNQVESLKETLKEELDSFFYDVKDAPTLSFTGVDVYAHQKRKILYLNPYYDINLGYCSEIVLDICKSFIKPALNYKQNKKQFLPLGYFSSNEELHKVMEQASLEFRSNGELEIESISLYEKKFGLWVEREVLLSFEKRQESFLQETIRAL